MTDSLLPTIQHYLDTAAQPNRLRDLFAQTLLWGRPQGAAQPLAVGSPVSQTLMAQPVAQLGSLPVFQITWPDTKLPTVTERRAVYHTLAQVALEHLLCYVTQDGRRLALVWARDRGGKRVELRTLPYDQGTPARTTIERLAALAFRLDEFDMFGHIAPNTVIARLNAAFDVEAVTKQFFATYRQCFDGVESQLTGISDARARRLFTQKLFNRLMFIVFLERKGWLTYQGQPTYLRALWQAHLKERVTDASANFYQSRLTLLFFAGLNTPHEVNVVDIQHGSVIEERIGRVPYLNGGLFEEEADDRDPAIQVPDGALESVITELFYRFNFTVTESTPFDLEVAVDPEMLGKVFEELVTGRHESGSYYTPRPIVAFMCREGLKGYLQTKLPTESPEVIARFVDERGASDLRNPEAALAALTQVRVCDPACGSGAYLLGMLQELLALRTGLFTARKVDAVTTYERKLAIIQANLYGVDLDPFAVNIARLRLWLSLVVEYEGEHPPPLPNLDYKVETGDSLAAPDPSGGVQPDMFRRQQIADYFDLKDRYLRSHGTAKLTLRAEVTAKEQEIAAWAHPKGGVQGFDWAVGFAEVFVAGGFDIVVANPPYVRMELFKEIKPVLRANFPEVHSERADLYVYFYGRAVQILRTGGMLTFISSNKWLKAVYGGALRKFISDTCQVNSIIDFGDLPVFQSAMAYPTIFIAQKRADNIAVRPTIAARISSLDEPYPDILSLLQSQGSALNDNSISGSTWSLTHSSSGNFLSQMESKGSPIGKILNGQIYRGIVTGLNKAFVISRDEKDFLISRNPKASEIIKPLLAGRDIKKWSANQSDRYLLYMYHGVSIRDLSAVINHLQPFRGDLEGRATEQPWYELQQPQMKYRGVFDAKKIVYQEISTYQSFAMDTLGVYTNNKVFMIPSTDLFLLTVLNSTPVWAYLSEVCSKLAGGTLALQASFVSKVPIPPASESEQESLRVLAQKCLDAKGQGAQVAAWEAEIDERVGRLYGLSSAEIAALRGEQGKG